MREVGAVSALVLVICSDIFCYSEYYLLSAETAFAEADFGWHLPLLVRRVFHGTVFGRSCQSADCVARMKLRLSDRVYATAPS